jgi:hypothetical protein
MSWSSRGWRRLRGGQTGEQAGLAGEHISSVQGRTGSTLLWVRCLVGYERDKWCATQTWPNCCKTHGPMVADVPCGVVHGPLRFRNIVMELESLHRLELVQLEAFLDAQVCAWVYV